MGGAHPPRSEATLQVFKALPGQVMSVQYVERALKYLARDPSIVDSILVYPGNPGEEQLPPRVPEWKMRGIGHQVLLFLAIGCR